MTLNRTSGSWDSFNFRQSMFALENVIFQIMLLQNQLQNIGRFLYPTPFNEFHHGRQVVTMVAGRSQKCQVGLKRKSVRVHLSSVPKIVGRKDQQHKLNLVDNDSAISIYFINLFNWNTMNSSKDTTLKSRLFGGAQRDPILAKRPTFGAHNQRTNCNQNKSQ